jgi:hypothetical protein
LLHGVGDNQYSCEIQGRLSMIVEGAADPIGPPPLVVMPFRVVTQQNKIARRFPRVKEFDDTEPINADALVGG